MPKVFLWPPVAAVSRRWTFEAPVSVSRDVFTGGAAGISAGQRRRRLASIEASARFSPHQAGAGYMEALKFYLDGGVNLVRLYHKPTIWCPPDVAQSLRSGGYFGWISDSGPFTWEHDSDPFLWTYGNSLAATVTTDAGVPAVTVGGLPPDSLLALPGEWLELKNGDSPGAQSRRYMVAAPAHTDASGNATIRLATVETLPTWTVVNVGVWDTAVFEALEIPDPVQPSGGDWSYNWEFREVFPDERGDLLEVNPWS